MTDLELEHRDIGHGVTIRRAEEREYDQVGQALLEAFTASGKITEHYRQRLLGITPRSKTEDVWVAEDVDGQIIGAY
ncbi:hypothetical protein [Bifidobacterium merycicum]|uniref:hypothetical protein n=1 Tax=Bifidobacterium merycicum TaxID=78345 RepID=UPI0005298552|nr:hypothetical protein [Bifidobacterium merycicum]